VNSSPQHRVHRRTMTDSFANMIPPAVWSGHVRSTEGGVLTALIPSSLTMREMSTLPETQPEHFQGKRFRHSGGTHFFANMTLPVMSFGPASSVVLPEMTLLIL